MKNNKSFLRTNTNCLITLVEMPKNGLFILNIRNDAMISLETYGNFDDFNML